MSPGARHGLVVVARVAFIGAVLVATAVTFGGHGDEIAAAVTATPLHRVALAASLVIVGLVVTSVAWLRLLAAFGHPLPHPQGRAVFFVGQLGKYVPGGIWSIGAHAHLAGAHDVPARVTASTSLVFLGLNLATACLVVGVVGTLGALSPLFVVGGLLALFPPLATRLAAVVAGSAGSLAVGWRETALLAALLLVTWSCYAAAVVAISPGATVPLLATAAGAFSLSYAVGVAVVVAPAGLGVREVTLVALLAPAIGVGPAGAVALLTRVLHTTGDLALALAAWLLVRRARGPRPDSAGWPGVQHQSTRRS